MSNSHDRIVRLCTPWGHGSASQVKDHLRCPSRWYGKKILKIRIPESEGMRRGKREHKGLELWELDGDEGHLTPTTLPILELELFDVPIPADQVEARIDLDTRVVPLIGYIDLKVPADRTVYDHKTTSSFRWCLTPEELSWDPQCIIYLAHALEEWGGDEPITFVHLYYRTKNLPKTRVVSTSLTPDQIRERFDQIVDRMETMRAHSKLEFEIIPINENACGDYGGCPIRVHCTRAGKLGGPFAGFKPSQTPERRESMTYAEMLLARRRAQEGNAPTPIIAPPVEVHQEPEPVEVQEPEPVEVQEPEPPISLEVIEINQVLASSINPPDGTPMDELPPEPELTAAPATKKTRGLRVGDELVSTMKKSKLAETWHALAPRKGVEETGSPLLLWDGKGKVSRKDLQTDVTTMLEAGWTLSEADKDEEKLRELRELEERAGMPLTPLVAATEVPVAPCGRPQHATTGAEGNALPDGGCDDYDCETCYPMEEALFSARRMSDGKLKVVEHGGIQGCVEVDPLSPKDLDFDGCLPSPLLPEILERQKTERKDKAIEAHYREILERQKTERKDKAIEAHYREILERQTTAHQTKALHDLAREEARAYEERVANPSAALLALYIGCHPHGRGVVYADELLAPLQDKVAEDAAVPHYGMLSYGEGPKRVAALLRAGLDRGDLSLPRELVVDRRSPCADAVLDVLIPLYRRSGGIIVERMG